jgi:Flp pilus assembly protein TadG
MRGTRSRLKWQSERGQALLEAALITPVVLLIMVGIFEVGRAYQTFQVLTNAAREGARAAVVPGANATTVKALVKQYMTDGALGGVATANVEVNQAASIQVNGTNIGATLVTVDYPFSFIMLQPVARLVVHDSDAGSALTMRATSLMRNEAQ